MEPHRFLTECYSRDRCWDRENFISLGPRSYCLTDETHSVPILHHLGGRNILDIISLLINLEVAVALLAAVAHFWIILNLWSTINKNPHKGYCWASYHLSCIFTFTFSYPALHFSPLNSIHCFGSGPMFNVYQVPFWTLSLSSEMLETPPTWFSIACKFAKHPFYPFI